MNAARRSRRDWLRHAARLAALQAGAVLGAPMLAMPARARAQSADTFTLVHGDGLWLLDRRTLAVQRRLRVPGLLAEQPFALHARAPALLAGRDGRLLRIAPDTLEVLAERRSGLALSHAVAAADGRWLFAAAGAPERLLVFDADGNAQREYPAASLDGQRRGPVALLRTLAPRRSVVALLPGAGEAWELSHDPAAEPVYDGLVHDFRLQEGVATPGFLGRRRSRIEPTSRDWFADAAQPWLAATVDGATGRALAVLQLDVRRVIVQLPLGGAPLPQAGAAYAGDSGQPVFALPDAAAPRLHRVDARRWQPLPALELPAPAAQLCAHAQGALLCVLLAGDADAPATLLGLDRASGQPVARWRAEQRPLALAFTPDGSRLLCLERGGASAQVLDARDLRPLARLPLS